MVIDVEDTEKEKVERKEMASRSEMWQHFIKIKDNRVSEGCKVQILPS